MALYDNNGAKFTPKDIEGITSKVFWLQTRAKNRISAIYFENTKCKYYIKYKLIMIFPLN